MTTLTPVSSAIQNECMILVSSNFTGDVTNHGEQRQTPRVPADFHVYVETDAGDTRSGWAVDIGLGGMFIEIDQVPSYASFVAITIVEPIAPPVRIPAVVRWTTANGFGVQFGLLGARDTSALVALLEGLSKCQEEAVTLTMRRTLCS
jgi:type IV pilus assembly protein PilZ